MIKQSTIPLSGLIKIVVAFSFSVGIFCSSTLMADTSIYQKAINHPDRPASDVTKDVSRKPLEILPFSKIVDGAQVLEIGAGGGYTTELVSRIIGAKGKVYAETLSSQRIAGNRLENVTALRRHKLYQLPEVLAEQGVKEGNLDVVIIFFALHDVMMNPRIDQQEFLNNIYKLLKPGGHFVVLDNSAKPDSGLKYTRSLHRIGENYVKQKVTSVGFILDAESNSLRNLNDNLDQAWSRIQGKQDRFAFRFKKP
jgi:predicted methyltransferase